MLELNNVEVLYSDVILAVKGISAKVPDASCVTLLGANGAGKSTTLKAISNLIKTEDGRVSAGAVLAARLSEDPDAQVLLLEAGGPDASVFIRDGRAQPASRASPSPSCRASMPRAFIFL